MLDAYTVRKAIPRIVLAVIGINLSIYLCIAVIDIVNIIGHGLGNLMTTPFLDKSAYGDNAVKNNVSNNIAGITGIFVLLGVTAGAGLATVGAITGATAGIFATAAAAAGGIGIALIAVLVPIIISVALILMSILFTLVIRQALIIFLVVVSPVAIALFVLPGTEKYFKKWFDLFIKTLMVYPIISVIFAMSTIMATVLLGSAPLDAGAIGLTKVLASVVVVFAPLVMIPFAFKLAGGAIAAVMNAANGRTGNIAGRVKQQMQKSQQDPTSFLGKRKNKSDSNRLQRGATFGQIAGGMSALARGRGMQGYHDASATRGDIQGRRRSREAQQNNALMQQLGFDDAGIAVMALSGGTREGAERAADRLGLQGDARRRAIASAEAVGIDATNTTAAIDIMAQQKSRLLTGALGGDAGMALVRESALQASGDNRQLQENIMGSFAFHSRGAGRLDLGGESHWVRNDATGTAELEAAGPLDGWQRSTIGQHGQSFGESARQFGTQATAAIQSDDDGIRQAGAIALMEMQNTLANSTPEVATHLNRALADAGVDHDLTRLETISQPDGRGGLHTREVPVRISVEEQLANIANGFSANGTGPSSRGEADPIISASRIRGQARVYDGNVPVAERGAPPTPGPTPGAGGGAIT